MKRIFSIFLVCCTVLAYANDIPDIEECDETEYDTTVKLNTYSDFAIDDPILEENEESCKECEKYGGAFQWDASSPFSREHPHDASYSHWPRFKINFGLEKVFVRFPQKPAVARTNILLTAYAYDYTIQYSATGYSPPIGNIYAPTWFEEVLNISNRCPYSLVGYTTFQTANGDWVMDYTVHDEFQNLTIKARAIVTPYNAYTFQCIKPAGVRDHFDYFLDNLWIQCDCQ
jgi:hypothetical protein